MIAERWLRTWSCWRGDARSVLRPEAHHQDLEDHWGPLGRNWKNERKNQNGKETRKHPSARVNLELLG